MKKLTAGLAFLIATTALAKSLNETIWSAQRGSTTVASEPFNVEETSILDLTASVTESQPANDTFISGVAEVQTLDFADKASTADGDYIQFFDASGTSWAVALDTTGAAAVTPTGAVWVSVAAANKVLCDINAATNDEDVAAAVELCIDALVGLTDVIISDDTAADGTMLLTQVEAGPTSNPVPKTFDDSGAGSIAGVQTTGGVAGNVSVAGNTAAPGAHGYLTGLKVRLTTSSALPTGLLTGTDYWLIKVDNDRIKFASSAANALAGTAIDLTAIGTGTQTVVVDTDLEGDIKLQRNDAPYTATAVWVDVLNSTQAVDAGGNFAWSIPDAGFRQIRAVYIGESSEATINMYMNGK